ncbi:beta strand repeat-containing protein, partial [Vreelandella venusta]|uniref:beta strand repeat-containing protein n=1 Tax=Vreelandella venusta TaxID=44935 RepID=UPI0040439CFA
MAGNTITNVAPGVNGTDAVNVDQLTDVSNVANKGWDLTANGEATGENIAPGETADFSEGKNIAITRTSNSIEVATADDVEFTNVEVTENLNVAGDTNIAGDTIIGGSTTINENLTVEGTTQLGDNFFVNNEGNVTYEGDITENNHITNKQYVDNSVTELGDTPLTFAGDSGTSFERKLGEQTNVKGGSTGTLTDGNIGVVADGTDTLQVKLAENIDLGTNGSVVMGDTTVNNSGLTIAGGPSITNTGIDAGNTTITNVAPGVNGTDAVNVDQLTDVSDVANKGWDLTANGEATGENIAPGETADFSEGKNIAITRTDNSIEVATAEDVDFTNVNVTNQLDVAGDTNIGGNTTIQGDTTVKGDTFLGDNFSVVNNEAIYDGPINNDNSVVNKQYVDGIETHYYSVNDNGTTQGNYDNDGATGINALAAGTNAKAEGNSSLGMGDGARTASVGEQQVAVGANALAGGNKSVAIGSGAKASTDMFNGGVEAVAIGNNASAQGTKNVALGSGSVANGSTLSTTAYQPLDVNGNPATVAAPTADSEVSVGSAGNERRITNVAAGAEDTDAVNVSQLKAVNDVASAGWNVQTNGDAATNVAPNATVQFIDGKNIDITRIGTDITVATADDVDFTNVNVTNQLDVAGDTNIGGNTTINGDTTVKGDTYLGDNFSVVNNEAFYDGAITENTHIVNKEYVDGGIGDLANTPITFAGDTGTTDRKLGDELNIVTSNANLSTEVTDDETLVIAMSNDLDVNSVTTNSLDVANNATIGGALNVTGQTTLNGGLDMAGNKITNVAPGTDGTDAVNVDQLTDVSDVANKGWDLTANGEATGENIAPGETADFTQGKNIAITRTGNSIEVATADDVEFTNVEVTENLNVAGDTNIAGDTIIGGSTTINENLTVEGTTQLGDNFVVNNDGNVTYTGDITEGDHITNKTYVDGLGDDLVAEGLNFAGNDGVVIHKDLGEQLNIVGGM